MKQSMNDNSRCCFHPDEVVVGVCPPCLNERLLVLAAKRKQLRCRHQFPCRDPTGSSGYYGTQGPFVIDKKKQQQQQQHRPAAAAPPKIFGWFFFNRRWKSDAVTSYHDASSSPEDSFISIRFEDNGLCSWEKNAASKVSFENCKASWNKGLRKSTKEDTSDKEHRHLHGTKWICKETDDVVERVPPRASLRWRRRIGHLFHLIRWKSSSKGNVCHVDRLKMRNGWIRTLTRRRTKETK